MACLTLTLQMIILMSVFFLLPMKTGLGMKQIGICRAICSGNDCITVYQESMDFKTAEEACGTRNGELLTLKPQMDERSLADLSHVLFGHYWIGLSLPAGLCSNLSAPLRGYKWTSGGDTPQSFNPSFNLEWKNNVEVCAPHCVSLSNDQKWTERPCSDKTDGYMCRTKHKDACQAQELSDSKVFKDPRGCSTGPCMQDCKDVKGGYVCLCFDGYIPDTKDPRRCKMHCAHQHCPLICENPGSCSCPFGYIDNNGVCEDIDECEMKQCEQKCNNNFGSFVCSCDEGFVLKDEVHCKASNNSEFVITVLNAEGSGKPVISNNSTVQASSASAGGFLWMWIFVVAAVVALIFAVRLYVVKRHKRRQQNSHQQFTATAPVANIKH